MPSGDTYEGGFEDDLRWGRGVLVKKGAWTYVGKFRRNEMHGPGVQTFLNGEIHEGSWYWGKKNGCFKVTMPNGEVYFQFWSEDELLHDKGKLEGDTMTYSDGYVY